MKKEKKQREYISIACGLLQGVADAWPFAATGCGSVFGLFRSPKAMSAK